MKRHLDRLHAKSPLVYAFGAALVLLFTALAWFSYAKLAHQLQLITHIEFPAYRHVAAQLAYLNDIQLDLATMAGEHDLHLREAIERDLAKHRAIFEREVKSYGELIHSPEEARDWRALHQKLDAWLAAVEAQRTLEAERSRHGFPSTPALDARILDGLRTLRALDETADEALEKLVDTLNDTAEERQRSADTTVSRIATAFLIAFMGCAGLAAALILTVRSNARRQAAVQQAERERAFLARRLELITRHGSDALFFCDPAGKIVETNDGATALYGHTREEILQLHFHDLFPHEMRTDALQHLQTSVIEPSLRNTLQLRKDGSTFSSELALSAIELQRAQGYLAVVRDVTESRHAAEALRAKEKRLQQILATSNDGVWIGDLQGHTEYANARLAQILGFDRASVIDLPPLAFFPPERRDIALADLATKIARGESVRREFKVDQPDGSEVWIVLSATPLRDEADRITGCIAVLLDGTALRHTREELQQAQKLEAVGRLAAGIAHEINTPIQYIGDNTHFLQESFTSLVTLLQRYREAWPVDAPVSTTRELRATWEELDLDYVLEHAPLLMANTLHGVERVSTIVRAMRDFAHPGSRAMTATDLNRALRATVEVARSEFKYVADVELALGNIPFVVCFAGDLNQVFLNVIVNAAHAIEDKVKQDKAKGLDTRGKIGITTAHEGQEVVVSISDTGCGIPESIRSKIFEPFFTTKEVGRGTGQGLALAHRIVTHHKGRLTFSTTVGQGTTFFIRLPVNPHVASAPGAPTAPSPTS